MPSALTQVGAYPLTGTGKLPNADVASPGEVWSNKRASGVIVPGSLVKPTLVGSVGSVAVVAEGDTVEIATAEANSDATHVYQGSLAVALRQIMVPDLNPGSQYNPALGPNEIVNLPIASGDWVRTVHTGVLHLTLVVPKAGYKEGDIIGWNPKGARPALKTAGEGAWQKVGDANTVAGTGIFIVQAPPRYYGTENEAILTVRFLRSNQ
jgi:hypothetical protein